MLRLSEDVRHAWLDGYLEQLLTRDAEALDGPRDPARLRRYFRAVALDTAGLAERKTLYDAAGINRKTALAYDQLLMNLFVLDAVPAWTTNRLTPVPDRSSSPSACWRCRSAHCGVDGPQAPR